jgi:hypothetical protein
MNGKAVPLLLIAATVAVVAAALLATKPSATGHPDSLQPRIEPDTAGGVPAGDFPSSQSASGENAPEDPAQVAATVSPGSAGPTTRTADAEVPFDNTSNREEPVRSGGTTPADREAVEVVSQTLAAAGLSGAGLSIAGTGSAPTPESATDNPSQPPAAKTRELTIPVPTGAKVPVVFYDQEPRPLPQQEALDRIAGEFSEIIGNPPSGYTPEEVWEAARKLADERYIVLYGFDSYNQISIRAAKEALKEKKAAPAATP